MKYTQLICNIPVEKRKLAKNKEEIKKIAVKNSSLEDKYF